MAEKETQQDLVVLLHGIGRTLWNMDMLARCLRKAGYAVLNLRYPSRHHPIAELVGWLKDRLEAEQVWQGTAHGRVHFVCHSMGGLITGFYLAGRKDSTSTERLGRVVMLGTPHGGSELADWLQHNPLYRWYFGPAGQELTTTARTADQIAPWYPLGIIAGRQSWLMPLTRIWFPGANDGMVSVESTKLDGMADHITVSVIHGLMGWSPTVQRHVVGFLREGVFVR
ncbi:MAG: esterase/lipase family protein [Rhodospirillaceae bacterium]